MLNTWIISIGDTMDDYAKARYKSNGTLTVMKLTTPEGGMNPLMSVVDFIQDGDLNKSLKHYVSESGNYIWIWSHVRNTFINKCF